MFADLNWGSRKLCKKVAVGCHRATNRVDEELENLVLACICHRHIKIQIQAQQIAALQLVCAASNLTQASQVFIGCAPGRQASNFAPINDAEFEHIAQNVGRAALHEVADKLEAGRLHEIE